LRSKQKSELHSTKMALAKPLLCRNLGLRYVRANYVGPLLIGGLDDDSNPHANYDV